MKKSVGILGGMGPMATAELFYKIVNNTDAHSDGEHLRVFMDNNPAIPDRTAAILRGGESPLPALYESLHKLISCGADCIIIPCNTSHHYLPQLQKESPVPILNMPEITAEESAKRFPGKKAGILATKGTLAVGIYQEVLKNAGVSYIIPDEEGENALMRVIYDGIKAGKDGESYREDIENTLSAMKERGADFFILGCTELPIAVKELNLKIPYVDSLEELAKAAVKFCGAELK